MRRNGWGTRTIGVVAGLLVCGALGAPSAFATVTLSHDTSTPGSGTTTVSGDSASDSVFVSLYKDGGVAVSGGTLSCNTHSSNGFYTDLCDEFSGQATLVASGSNCATLSGSGNVVCVDTSAFSGDLGAGSDTFSIGDVLYKTATISGGAGDDTLTGTIEDPTSSDPNVDIFDGGPGNDDLTGNGGDDQLHGGDDIDQISGGPGNDVVDGGPGNDYQLLGGPGNDTVEGGDGDDIINLTGNGDPGADTYSGGAGSDSLDYGNGTTGVRVTLDGQPNDGISGEDDNVGSDIEKILGTYGDDTLIGDGGPNYLDGGDGNDVIQGGGGNDTLLGGYGDDTIDGGPGTDSVYGDATGCNISFGTCPAGNDTILVRDGEQDQVNCGPGADRVTADQLDILANDPINGCETVDRATVGAGGTGSAPTGAPGTTSGFTPASLGLSATRPRHGTRGLSHGLKIGFRCPSACKATATLAVSKRTARKAHLGRKTRVGSASATLHSAGSRKLTIKLTRKARSGLRRLRHVTIKLTLKVKLASGQVVTATKSVKV